VVTNNTQTAWVGVARYMPHHRTLVVVEDPLVSNLVRAVLRKQGYSVVVANPSEAADLLRLPGEDAGILVTNLPVIFREFAETVPLLYLSSNPDPQLEGQFRFCRVVRKPFAPSELVKAVNELAAAL
jgi:DNA-binding response OmpR family regulator